MAGEPAREEVEALAEDHQEAADGWAHFTEAGHARAAAMLRALAARVEALTFNLEAARRDGRDLRVLWAVARGEDPEDRDDGPRCRDCADADGRCPVSGRPCDPQEEAIERIKEALALQARVEALTRERDAAVAEPHGEAITFAYTNWRGETAIRTVLPARIFWGANEWHPEPQWLMRALDVDRGEPRDFALKECDFALRAAPGATDGRADDAG